MEIWISLHAMLFCKFLEQCLGQNALVDIRGQVVCFRQYMDTMSMDS